MDIYTIREEMLRKNKRLTDLNLRVVYYARVSTEKDAQLHSLSAQKSYFENKISQNPNWTLIGGYVDEGISATRVKNRDNFLQMIKDAKSDKFDLILTKEITRFARNTLDSLSYTQDLLRHGVGVCFENDNLNTLEPDSELRLTIMSGIAQDESRKISERVSFGFKQSVKKGIVLGNNSIWGYRKENGKLVIVPDEAKMVRTIFDLYANKNMGIRTIAKTISEMGYRNTNGNPFSFSSVKGILINPKYKGFYCGNKTHKIDFRHDDIKHLSKEEWIMYEDNDAVPPIVSPSLWDKANKKLSARSRELSKENKTSYQNKYLYSGKILCGNHGACYHHTVYKYKSGNKELWTCKEYANGNKCRNPLIYTTELNSVMHKVFDRIFCEKASIADELIDLYKETDSTKATAKSRYKLQSDIKLLLSKKDKLLDLVTDDKISGDEFKERNDALSHQIFELSTKLSQLDCNEQNTLNSKDYVKKLYAAIIRNLEFNEIFSKGILDSFVEKIIVHKGDAENEIGLKIFLKVLPTSQPLPENNTTITFDTGQVIKTRGGNSRSLKEFDVNFNYELCYCIE